MIRSVTLTPLEMLALKKLAIICGALANSLDNASAAREQRALTKVLLDVIVRAEFDITETPDAAE